MKILLISLSNVGDVVLTTPVISILRKRFPQAELTVMVGPRAAGIVEASTSVDRVLHWDKKRSWVQHLQFIWRLRQARYDMVVDLRNSGIPLFINAKKNTPYWMRPRTLSMRERHLDRLRQVISFDNEENHFNFYTPEEKKEMEMIVGSCGGASGSDWAVLVPGAGSSLKRWTLSGFIETGRHLSAAGKKIAIVGHEAEKEIGEAFRKQADFPYVDLIGALTLRQLAAFLSQVSLVVTNDSGVMHLAQELGRPTVSVFGPTNEKKYGRVGPLHKIIRLHLDCAPCEQAQCRLARRACLDDVNASSVIEAAKSLI